MNNRLGGARARGVQKVFTVPGRQWTRSDVEIVFEWLFSEKFDYLVRFVLRHLGPRSRIPDAVEVWSAFCIRSLESLIKNYDPRKGRDFWGYMLFCLERFCHRQAQHLRNRRFAETEGDGSRGSEAVDLSRQGFTKDLETRDLVTKALDRLNPPFSTVLRKYYLEEKSVDDIASEMAASPAAVKTWLHRARQKMRDALVKLGWRADSTEVIEK